MKFRIILIAALFVAATIVSCNKEGDTTKPTIELYEPEDGEVFAAGGEICVEMDLSDDTALASFKIDVHNAFDGHEHTTEDSKSSDDDDYNTDTDNAFSYNKTSEDLGIDISGLKNSFQHIHLEIPETAAHGDYHLMIYCYDTEGNESYVARSISIDDEASSDHDHDE